MATTTFTAVIDFYYFPRRRLSVASVDEDITPRTHEDVDGNETEVIRILLFDKPPFRVYTAAVLSSSNSL
jgi:hypothetical protein